VTPTVSAATAKLVLKAWQGERYGVQVYSGLAETREVPEHARKLTALVQLERLMLARLDVLLEELGISADLGGIEVEGARDIEAQSATPWNALLRWISADAALALDDYLRLDQMSVTWAASQREVALAVIQHERAIINFCTKELAGEIDALREVEQLTQTLGE